MADLIDRFFASLQHQYQEPQAECETDCSNSQLLAANDQIQDALSFTKSRELILAYNRIKDPSAKKHIMKLAKLLVGPDRATGRLRVVKGGIQ